MKEGRVSLSAVLSRQPKFRKFAVWIVGNTPLITHAWSEKAKLEMLEKQVKATKGGRDVRDPQADFVNSLYPMGGDAYGFPVTGIKNCIMSAAHKDKGVARTAVMSALYLDADMVRVAPAKAGAICDLPLVRIYGTPPVMREDMVRIGTGMTKTANLAYRGQFTQWAILVTGEFNTDVMTEEQLAFLLDEAGRAYGLGEWRNEKKGMFGAFHLATVEEETAWNAFASGTGPLPDAGSELMAAE